MILFFISMVLLAVLVEWIPNRRKLRAPDWVAFAKALDFHVVSYCIPLTTGFGWASDMENLWHSNLGKGLV